MSDVVTGPYGNVYHPRVSWRSLPGLITFSKTCIDPEYLALCLQHCAKKTQPSVFSFALKVMLCCLAGEENKVVKIQVSVGGVNTWLEEGVGDGHNVACVEPLK